ncbi:MAG: HAMP domain-containing histidine kinase, partial [Lachnospiraceae bacterium]|nr:HAMP domain-containing histidine kinase [Lachnospiraceae bacterium]
AGKTLLFILCTVCAGILAASVTGAVCFMYGDMEIYTMSEEEFSNKIIDEGQVRSIGYDIMRDELMDKDPDTSEGSYTITDSKGKPVAQKGQFQETDEGPFTLTYGVLKGKKGKVTDIFYHYAEYEEFDQAAEYYTLTVSFPENTMPAKKIGFLVKLAHAAYTLRYAVYLIGFFSLLGMIISFISLMSVSGRRPRTEDLVPGPLYRVPYDLLLFLIISAAGILIIPLADNLSGYPAVAYALAYILVVFCMGLGLCMSTAVRIKGHTLLKNTLTWRILKLAWHLLGILWRGLVKLHRFNMTLLGSLPLIWKTLLGLGLLSLLELFGLVCSFNSEAEMILVLWFLEKLVLVPAVLYLALILRRLQKGGAALAAGDLSYQTNTRGMFWDFKKHGEDLNSIASGMAIAVEDRMKSERMKTELITNVSHDIKTPLTSIINYASLIGEAPNGPAVPEYAQVLLRQSEKLKRLIDDLVEASKASTGNLDVLLSPCDASVFLTQAAGEYEEKLQAAHLTLVTKQPDRELRIMADGRRMWRIFDNLMNNICKYAQPGTRVYLSLEEKDGKALISFKN